MCEQARKPFATSSKPAGSRRRRVWELPDNCHCPVIGVCLPIDTIARLLKKAGSASRADYDDHILAVGACASRNTTSELLQDALERRHAVAVQRFRCARTADEVLIMWHEGVGIGEAAGAFWAGLTHPRCDARVEGLLCREMHMIQHQAGASDRVARTVLLALQEENAILTRQLAKVQDRCTRLLAEKSQEVAAAESQLMRARAELVARESALACANAARVELEASIPGLASRQRLQEHNTDLQRRIAERDREIHALITENARLSRPREGGDPSPASEPTTEPIALNEKTVLCVGGRTGSLAHYRGVVEEVGGKFSHHDGGREDSHELLDASLAAADLVICQTGCISHNAYWRVKDHCKRTGKLCAFVDNPSTTSFTKTLNLVASK
jgi:hypothetical protein